MLPADRSMALACTPSMPPYSVTARAINAATEASTDASNWCATAVPPAAVISATARSAASKLRSPTTTRAPSAPRRTAVTPPMLALLLEPSLAPSPPAATTITLSLKPPHGVILVHRIG